MEAVSFCEAESHEFQTSRFRAFPLPPKDASQTPPDPTAELFKHSFGFRRFEGLSFIKVVLCLQLP
jgi:hypothetical protein